MASRTIIEPNYNDTTPAPPSGRMNVAWQKSAVRAGGPTGKTRDLSGNLPNLGGVDPRTTTVESIHVASQGKCVTFNNSSAVACSLDSTVPSWFICTVKNKGTGAVTFTPTSGVLDYTTPIVQGGGGILFFDGTNWTLVPFAAGGFTAGGDLSGTSTTQQVIGILNKAIDGTTSSLADGDSLVYSSATGKWELVVDRFKELVSYVPGQPASGQIVIGYVATTSMTFPADFASPNSQAKCGTNPAATATYSVYKNGTLVGTIAIATSGAPTFATVGHVSFSLNASDVLTVVAPGSVDASMADVKIALLATRTTTVPSAAVPPILNWRGLYSGAATYQPYDMASFAVSGKIQSYMCVAATTGNDPTHTAFWSLMAQAGADGSVTSAQLQQAQSIYVKDAGSANAISVTLSPAPNVVDGSIIFLRVKANNTGAVTATAVGDTGATGGAAKPVVKQGGTALVAGDLKANQCIIIEWDNDNSQWEVIGGGGSGGADVNAQYLVAAADALLPNSIVFPVSGTPIYPIGPGTGSNASWQNFSIWQALFAPMFSFYPASGGWKVVFAFVGGTGVSINKCKVLKVAKGTLTVLSATTVNFSGSPTFSASFTASTTNPFFVTTDAIGLALDNAHDYYVMIYLDSASANSTLAVWNAPLAGLAYSQFASGDQTGVSTVAAVSGTTHFCLYAVEIN